MATYTDSQKARIMDYPLDAVLQHFGKRTDHRGEMYYSPFRDEANPSFHIKRSENVWMDFGSGEGGNVLTLVSLLGNIPLEKCWDYVAGLDPNIVVLDSSPASSRMESSRSSRIIIDSVKESFTFRNLILFAQRRGIPRHILEHYCRQVTYHLDGRRDTHWTAIGFPAGDGWVLRHITDGPFAKRCTGSACTLLGAGGEMVSSPTCDRVEIFEGFFDFLSWLVLKDRTKPFSDICVLNSVNNLQKGLQFISAHKDISSWMDNDEAGRRALDTLKESCPDVRDHLSDLGENKDVNDLLTSTRMTVKNSIIPTTTQLFTIKKQ